MRLVLCAFAMTAVGVAAPTLAATGLANPAATFCIESGGHYGIRDTSDGQVGDCKLPDGTTVDAWDYFRAQNEQATPSDNPAAQHCTATGGTYSQAASTCDLPSGETVNAWDHAQSAYAGQAKLTNPAADHCVAVGGSYAIIQGDDGARGECTLPDGEKIDAWTLFRQDNPG